MFLNASFRSRSTQLMALIVIAAAILSTASPGSAWYPPEPDEYAQGQWFKTVVVPDNGAGMVDQPLAVAPYVGRSMQMVDGLPAGSSIQIDFRIGQFFDVCPPVHPDCYVVEPPPPGWESHSFRGSLTMWMRGTGALEGFARTITIPIACQIHATPQTPGQVVQSIETQIWSMEADLPPGSGDPDFDLLALRIGCGNLLRSPGHTTLTRMPIDPKIPANPGSWAVDSFFDVAYRIDFAGHPGGALSGMSGSTAGQPTVRMTSGEPLPVAPMNPFGSADTPALNIPVHSQVTGDTLEIIDGLPPGSAIEISPEIIPLMLTSVQPGSLGGPAYQMNGLANMQLRSDNFNSYNRFTSMPANLVCHVGPIDPAAEVQQLPNAMWQLQMQLPPGDPDFDLLRISAGNGFGMPSPGHTTLTRMPAGNWAVDSFFDITYRIDFVGAPGGPFGGMSGSTTGTIRMTQGGELPRYTIEGFGLLHQGLGAASMTVVVGSDAVPEVAISNIGSSGQDGVAVMLTGEPIKWNFPEFDADKGLEGWTGNVDFGPSGNLSLNSSITFMAIGRALSPSSGGYDRWSMGMKITETNNGQAMLSMVDDCGDTCPHWLCPYCEPPVELTVQLWNDGVQVASQTYLPPYPPDLVKGPFGLVDGAPPVLVSTMLDDSDGNGGIDVLRFVFSEPIGMTMQLSGGLPVTAKTIVLKFPGPMAPPMPNVPMPLITHIDITGANLPGGQFTLHKEGVVNKREYIVQYQESDWDFINRMYGGGDLDGDGRPDLIVADFDPAGTGGIQFFNPGSEPFRVWWPIPSLSEKMGAKVQVLDTPDGSLPPNAMLRAVCTATDADGDQESGTTSIVRCPGGTCTTGDLITFDLSEFGGTSCVMEILLGGQLVHSQTTPLVYQIYSKIKKDLSIEMERRSGGFFDGKGAVGPSPIVPRLVLKSFYAMEFVPVPGQTVVGDEVRFTKDGTGVDLYGLLDFQLTAANIDQLAILDTTSVPLPECPADIANNDRVVNIDDLVAVIINWGPCDPPCAPGQPFNCAGDVNRNCVVNIDDLVQVITNWGACP